MQAKDPHKVFDRVFCINLRRRQERWSHAIEQHRRLGIEVERFDAIDGQSVRSQELDPERIRLHYDTTENARWDRHVEPAQARRLSPGEIGCALSHVAIWQLVEDAGLGCVLVLEDDIEVCDDFTDAFATYWQELPKDWHVAFLGHHGTIAEYEQVAPHWIRPRYQFGTFAYALSRAGAKALLRTLPVRGPIDNFMADQFARVAAVTCVPPLIRHAGAWNERSDIVHSAQGTRANPRPRASARTVSSPPIAPFEQSAGADSGAPVFVMGCPRSGTTLLRYLLDSHERFACPPESKFIAGLYAGLQYPQAAEGLAGLGVDRREQHACVRAFIERVMGGYAARRGKLRWVDKTPNYYRIADFIDEVFEQRALYLFIVRHPLDAIDSWQRTLLDEQYRRADPDIGELLDRFGAGDYGAARSWCEINQKLDVFARCHPERTQWVRYEELVAAPELVLRRIMAFLGDTFSERMIRDAFDGGRDVGIQDGSILATSRIETGRVDRWRSWRNERVDALWSVVGSLALQLGYEAPARQSELA